MRPVEHPYKRPITVVNMPNMSAPERISSPSSTSTSEQISPLPEFLELRDSSAESDAQSSERSELQQPQQPPPSRRTHRHHSTAKTATASISSASENAAISSASNFRFVERIEEDHGCPIYAIAFNTVDPRHSDLFAVVSAHQVCLTTRLEMFLWRLLMLN
jgi:hypothetical protein